MFVCWNFQIVTFNYGMGDKNPMDELHFYAKNAPDVPFILRKDEASNDEVKIFYDLLIQHFLGGLGGESFSVYGVLARFRRRVR